MSELPDWLTQGADVAIYVHGLGLDSIPVVRPAKVIKITKTQVVVVVESDGRQRRFRRVDLKEVGHGDAWTPAPRLLSLDDEAVAEAERRAAVRAEINELRGVLDANPMRGDDVDDLLRQVVTVRVAAARAAVTLANLQEVRVSWL